MNEHEKHPSINREPQVFSHHSSFDSSIPSLHTPHIRIMMQRIRHWSTVLCEDEVILPPCSPRVSCISEEQHHIQAPIIRRHHIPLNTLTRTSSPGAREELTMNTGTYEAANVLFVLQDRPSVPNRIKTSAYSCDTCERTFKRKGDLKRHVRRVHEKIRDSICPICCKAFGEDYNMHRHVHRVHTQHRNA